MKLRVEFDRQTDGLWIGQAPELPAVLGYGVTQEEASVNVKALALEVIADHCLSS